MKTAKSYKIILLLTAFALSLVMALCTMNLGQVKAATSSDPANYFTTANVDSSEFVDGAYSATVKDGASVTLINKLVISDMKLEMSLPVNAVTTIKLTSNSFYVNGNMVGDTNGNKAVDEGETVTFETSVDNVIKLTAGAAVNDSVGVNLNGVDKTAINPVDGKVTLTLGSNLGYVSVNGEQESNIAKRIEDVANIAVAKISFSFDFNEGNDASSLVFKLNSVDQKASDASGSFKQTFAVDGGNLTPASPRVAINKSFYTKMTDGSYSAYKIVGERQTSMSLTAYSMLGNVSNSSLMLDCDDGSGISFETSTAPKKLIFGKTGAVSFKIVNSSDKTKVYETQTVNVIEEDSDTVAPVYVDDSIALLGFKNKLEKQYKDFDANTFVPLGTTLEIPSMEDLVFDDKTPYSELSSKTYVKTLANSTTVTDMEFDLDEVGSYLFYVAFTDKAGNAIEEDAFATVDDENNVTYGAYKKYIFTFVMEDDAKITVTAAVKEGVAYKGVLYTAASFDVDANGCTMTYKLYYNADTKATATGEGWKEIPKASSVTDKDYVSSDGYTYDEIKSVNFNGELKFVPTKLGAYKIECVATSDVSPRDASDYMIVRVESEPSVVKVDNKWLQNNIWSVVFLSIGTLCLIGIIVLLCIKPKDETED